MVLFTDHQNGNKELQQTKARQSNEINGLFLFVQTFDRWDYWRVFLEERAGHLSRLLTKEIVMVEQSQCEKCAALEREVAALKRERAELAAMVHSGRVKVLRVVSDELTHLIDGVPKTDLSISNKAKLLESRSTALGRLFSQEQAIAEMPLKIEHARVKIENTKARTALAEADTQLKREKVEVLRADRLLKEQQARLLEAAAQVLERYANGGDMVEADFEVIGELREIGLKFPAKLPAKNRK